MKRPNNICLEFGTFICSNCAGFHRNVNRKIKGIGASEFSKEEYDFIDLLQGNEVFYFHFFLFILNTNNML
jgi:hypothetical protein